VAAAAASWPHARPGEPHSPSGGRGAAACAAAGVRRLSLPPDAPEFAPLAAWWSKGKTLWRTKAARTLEALEQALAEALAAITSQEAHGGGAHAGYRVVSNGIPL